jgi:shikimate dehydrogenase
VILGAGGSARAITAALLEAGAPRVVLVNRTPARAEALAKALGGAIEVAERAPLADAALLVNTTSLGMPGQPPLEIDLAPTRPGAVVADIVYVPLETAFLARARALGLRTVQGLGMLLHQARPGFEAWFGVAPVVDDALHDFVAADIPKTQA